MNANVFWPKKTNSSINITIAILFVAGLFIFINLGKPEFWDDEAHVSLFAKNFNQFNVWTGWDGRNFIPDRDGLLGFKNDNTVALWQLDYLLTAVSFKIFGVSSYAARLPFAISAILCLALLYGLLLISVKKNKYIIWVMLSGALSTSYLLSARTCRYYAVAALSIVLCLLLWELIKKGSGWIYPILMSLSLSMLCYSSILIASAFVPAFLLTVVLFDRKSLDLGRTTKLAVSGLLTALIVVPYIYASILPSMAAMRKSNFSENNLNTLVEQFYNHIRLLTWNLEGLDLINAVPLGIGIIAIAAILIKSFRSINCDDEDNFVIRMSILLGFYIVFLSLLSPQPVKMTSIADVRYLFPVLPITFCIVGYVFSSLWCYMKSLAVLLFIAYICSNIFSPSFYFSQPRTLLPACVRDIIKPPLTSIGMVGGFLSKEAGVNDTVWWTPHFMGKPLQYLIGNRVLLSGGASISSPGADHLESLRRDLILENASPDWIIAFGLQPDLPSALKYFSESKGVNYTLAKVLNVYWGQFQRPELPWHRFAGETQFDPATEAVYIFHKDLKLKTQ